MTNIEAFKMQREKKVSRMRFSQWKYVNKGKSKKQLLALALQHLKQWEQNVKWLKEEVSLSKSKRK